MNKKLIFAAIAAIGVVGLVGCGSSGGSQTGGSSSQPAQTTTQGGSTDQGSNSGSGSGSSAQGATDTSKPEATATSAPAGAGDASKGKAVFDQSCASCHSVGSDQLVGPGLKGEAAKQTLNNGKPMNDANLTDWIKTGGTGKIGNMPGMGGTLKDDQIADVVAYIKTLK